MKIIIEHGHTKRKIDGHFNICGSKEDLLDLARQIDKACGEEFCYGWVNIITERQPSVVNTKPKDWDE